MSLGDFVEEVCRRALSELTPIRVLRWWIELHPTEPEFRLIVRRGSEPPDVDRVARDSMKVTWSVTADMIQNVAGGHRQLIDSAFQSVLERLDLT